LRFIRLFAGLVSLTFASAASGQSAPHVHGAGALDIAVDGHIIRIELTAPGSDIVGFEHDPQSDDDHKAISVAVGKLQNGTLIFKFQKTADCLQKEATVESDLIGHHEHAETKQTETHAEFKARYRFHCSTPEALKYIDLGYFSMFPRAVELDVRTITSKGQGAVELTPTSARLTF
jgi:hypothetical protein